jgi:DNA polymerase-3 subunit gamma/tau
MAAPRTSPDPAPRDEAAEIRAVNTFADLIALAAEKRDLATKSALERDVRLVRFEDGMLELALEPSARKTLVGELSKKLNDWTGRRWMVAVSAEGGMPSMRAQAEARKAELKDGVREDPLVQAVLARFPGAEIVDVRPPAGAAVENTDEMPDVPANESDPDA